MNTLSSHSAPEWTVVWREAFDAERGRQWMYDGTAREVAEAMGWRVLETHKSNDMVLAEREKGRRIAIGALPVGYGYGFWSVDLQGS
jgi:CxxC motif-containing protein (DUF1111 family)